ncbi:branched-chain amino acid ABC transporter permease [Kribbia dieselivorans]|uniref:branched-chain amino acid ABC transporter permease n=1 Tax=Kribbia dieselivorans TaxID=331526 RepID=UPI000838BFB7|nr:branched-chain amino acid ABC transporter permease [Kribbia dieselivorans]
MNLFIQLLLNGVVAGSVYALVAVGFALIFGATSHFHIAHAAVFSGAGYLAVIATQNLGLPGGVAAAVGLILAVLLGVALVRFLYTPLGRRGGQGFVLFLVSLGALVVVDNLFTINLGARPAQLSLGGWFHRAIPMGSWSMTVGQVALVAITVVAFTALLLVLTKTRAGKLITAYSGNPEFVEIVGRRPQRVLVLVYAAGSLFAALAGLYVAADTGMQPGLGETFFIISIMAVFIGGIGSVTGAFIAAMALGVLQNVLLMRIDAEWTLPVIFVLFLVLITVSPAGLSGLKLTSRRRPA